MKKIYLKQGFNLLSSDGTLKTLEGAENAGHRLMLAGKSFKFSVIGLGKNNQLTAYKEIRKGNLT